jgi:hypothetical protein
LASNLTPWIQSLILLFLLHAGHQWLLPFSAGYQKARSRVQRPQHQAICQLGCHVSFPHRGCLMAYIDMIPSGRCCGGMPPNLSMDSSDTDSSAPDISPTFPPAYTQHARRHWHWYGSTRCCTALGMSYFSLLAIAVCIVSNYQMLSMGVLSHQSSHFYAAAVYLLFKRLVSQQFIIHAHVPL